MPDSITTVVTATRATATGATAGKQRKEKCFIVKLVVFLLVQCWVLYRWSHTRSHDAPNILCNRQNLDSAIHVTVAQHRPTQQQQQQQQRSAKKKFQLPTTIYSNIDYDVVERLQRPFQIWNTTFPCFPPEQNWYHFKQQRQPTNKGFLYFKARKAGSSTVAGVALRIARNVARRRISTFTLSTATASSTASSTEVISPHCHTRYGHPPAHWLKYHARDKSKSFLWSIIREPTHRHVSEFFHFGVSRSKLEPTLINFQHYMIHLAPEIHNYYLQFMSTQQQFRGTTFQDMTMAVADIMNEYNFIGTSERMHESLVCLQLLLNLSTSDILYLSAKQNGGFDDGLAGKICHYIVPTYVSPAIQQYIQTEAWENFTMGDNLLYAIVNRSLDLTIDALGRTQFENQLQHYQTVLQYAQSRCSNVTFPCSPGGMLNENNDCYLWDSGCGYACLDQIAQELGLE